MNHLLVTPLLMLSLYSLFISPAAMSSTAMAGATVSYEVDGLSADAQIIVDEYGVPHIYADDHYDVFFVQGFNAARDRLWQIDLWKRRGLG